MTTKPLTLCHGVCVPSSWATAHSGSDPVQFLGLTFRDWQLPRLPLETLHSGEASPPLKPNYPERLAVNKPKLAARAGTWREVSQRLGCASHPQNQPQEIIITFVSSPPPVLGWLVTQHR